MNQHFSARLPLPVSHSQVHHSLLPSERGQPRQHLSGHPEREMVCTLRGQYLEGPMYTNDVLVKGLIAGVSC